MRPGLRVDSKKFDTELRDEDYASQPSHGTLIWDSNRNSDGFGCTRTHGRRDRPAGDEGRPRLKNENATV